MPLYTLTRLRDGREIGDEDLRAINDDQARAQAQLRLARCGAGETLILAFKGVERGRFGPRRPMRT